MNRISILCSIFFVFSLNLIWAEKGRLNDLDDGFSIPSKKDTKEEFFEIYEKKKETSDDRIKEKTADQAITKSVIEEKNPAKNSDNVIKEVSAEIEKNSKVVNKYKEVQDKNKTKIIEREKDKKINWDEEKVKTPIDDLVEDSQIGSMIYLFLGLTACGFLFLIFWYQKHMKQKLQGAGVSVTVLGQTWIDGSTRIILLKVGPKIITLAKSNNFCNAIDVISDPEEVNILTLSSNLPQNDKMNFKKTFSQAKKKVGGKEEAIPNASEIRQELDDLKKQLGKM